LSVAVVVVLTVTTRTLSAQGPADRLLSPDLAPLPANEWTLVDDVTDGDEDALRTSALPGDNVLVPRGDVWQGPPVEYAICPQDDALLFACENGVPPWQSTRFSDYKDGFFQKLGVSRSWLPDGRVDTLGLIEAAVFGTFALPAPTRDHPLLITPSFETRWLNGPITPDAPPRLYSGILELMWVPKITERWTGVLGATPGIYSDFQRDYGDEIRMMGRALGRYEFQKDRGYFVAGVLYLPRSDFRIIPAGGLMWSPWDDVQLDLIFPIPKVAYRLSYNKTIERWVYLAGEFGGGSWSVTRVSGASDVLTLRDYRVAAGFERKRDGGGGTRFEIGYVFARVLQYDSATPDVFLNDTIMLRARFAL
jgi:hypothetical protein